MPPDPKTVKLRAGAAVDENVKLYRWEEAGAKEVSVDEAGVAAEAVAASKSLILGDAASAVETIVKSLLSFITLDDEGAAVDSIDAVAKTAIHLREIQGGYRVFLHPLRSVMRLATRLRAFNASTREEQLGDGVPARLIGASIDGVDASNTLEAALADQCSVTPRLTTDQATPKGWMQGHRTRHVVIYMLGRSTAFDEILEDAGDSRGIRELRVNCLDERGHPTSLYAYDTVCAGADPILRDRMDEVYAYRFLAARVHKIPRVTLLKITPKIAATPLAIDFNHPEVKQPESTLEAVFTVEVTVLGLSTRLNALSGATGVTRQLASILEVAT